MTERIDPSTIFLEESRFWIQRIVVPILVCIGAAGNIISVIVLTRRRMRSSTNAYLTALAVADVIYLLFVLLLSFKHYPNINDRRYALYWRFYGISHWLCDAASSTSVWLTVSFTIERYIVVCHPMKGKVLCTEGRAKSIIAIVSILCLIVTATTPFEYQLVFKDNCIKTCDEDDLQILQPERASEIRKELEMAENYTLLPLDSLPAPEDMFQRNCTKTFTDDDDGGDTTTEKLIPVDEESLWLFTNSTQKLYDAIVNIVLLNTTCCIKNYTIETEPTILAKTEIYRKVFYWFSAICFGVLPLGMIATFNCFLISAVYRSHKKRKVMTNSQEKKSQYQENRITVLLIVVIILFLICQIPTASFLIYDALVETKDPFKRNIMKGLGNIFNSLLTLSASCNFIVYCVLSDKYRKTFKALFFKRGLNRQDTASIRSSRYSLRFSKKKLIKRGKSDYARTPRNLETQSLNSIPRSKSLMQRPLGKAKTGDLHF
ncbi:hypothetical protein ILUMI_03223 [Ignelater luminosus]|uniref:G-protein coupled receptors family 1 profile domain-containing protein n=1 Tax=Ignelater luminosus TaxID=2038154 RepID=A0A8K0GK47_IGNLU|nr:hypothetical protein ILUMI_03223 [Ignelater luminosus]